jgi:hypothetical protein
MNIDKDKCEIWIEMFASLIQMTEKLNNDEEKYIEENFSIIYGKLKLQKSKTKI